MSDLTNIEWTDSTFNPWIGCSKISAGCDNCYAEALTRRYGWVEWGPKGQRRRTSAANWKKPLAWNRAAERSGQRRRVFCASLADVMDNRAPHGAREDLYDLIRATPSLDWQLLTKRPENFRRFRPSSGWPDNVWLGVTAEDQTAYDRRWPILAAEDVGIRFISFEPALGSLSLAGHASVPDWLIWGGESGPGARPMVPEWARSVTAECQDRGVMVFGKQWGSYKSSPIVVEQNRTYRDAARLDPPSNGKGGALLDGRLWRDFPESVGGSDLIARLI